MKTGADISHWQAAFDAAKYKASGEDFIFLKATEGRTYVDPTFVRRWQAAKTVGLPRGAYCYGYPGSSMTEQADHFIRTVSVAGWQPGDVFILDMEASDNQSPTRILSWSDQWIDRVRSYLGGRGLFYTFPYFWRDQMGDPDHIPGNALGWWARYYVHPYRNLFKPDAWPDPPHVWQCSNGNTGCVKNVVSVGACDYNQMTDAAFEALFGGGVSEDMFEDADRQALKSVNDKLDALRADLTVYGTTGLKQTMELLYQRAKNADLDGDLIRNELAELANQEAARGGAVLAALAALDLQLSDEQIAQIASQINVDASQVAQAVQTRLHDALAQ